MNLSIDVSSDGVMEMRSEKMSCREFHEEQKVAGKRVSDGWSKASYDACCHLMSSTIIAYVENDAFEADRVVPFTCLLRTVDEISSPHGAFHIYVPSYTTLEYT